MCFCAKYKSTDFNNFKVTEFLVWPISDFRISKMSVVKAYRYVNIMNTMQLLLGISSRNFPYFSTVY